MYQYMDEGKSRKELAKEYIEFQRSQNELILKNYTIYCNELSLMRAYVHKIDAKPLQIYSNLDVVQRAVIDIFPISLKRIHAGLRYINEYPTPGISPGSTAIYASGPAGGALMALVAIAEIGLLSIGLPVVGAVGSYYAGKKYDRKKKTHDKQCYEGLQEEMKSLAHHCSLVYEAINKKNFFDIRQIAAQGSDLEKKLQKADEQLYACSRIPHKWKELAVLYNNWASIKVHND